MKQKYFRKILFLLVSVLAFGNAARAQEDVIYLYKGGAVTHSIHQAQFDSARVENASMLHFFRNGADIFSIARTEIDSIAFRLPAEKLTAPEDNHYLLLNYAERMTAAITFRWNGTLPEGAKLVFGTDAGFTQQVEVAISGNSKTFTHDELQALLIHNAGLGLKCYYDNTLYWNIKAGSQWFGSEARSLRIAGQRVFIDYRDPLNPEVYDVAVINEPGYRKIWLAEDLRATKFADDGSNVNDIPLDGARASYRSIHEFPSNFTYDQWAGTNILRPTERAKKSIYYEAGMGSQLHDKHWKAKPWEFYWAVLKCMVPNDWKFPTYQDWTGLFDAAQTATGSDIVLKDPVVFKNDAYGAWKINLAPTGRSENWYDGNEHFFYSHSEFYYLFDSGASGNPGYTHANGPDNINGSTVAFKYTSGDPSPYQVKNCASPMRLIYTGDDDPDPALPVKGYTGQRLRGTGIAPYITKEDIAELAIWKANVVRWMCSIDTEDMNFFDHQLKNECRVLDQIIAELEKHNILLCFNLVVPPGGRNPADGKMRAFQNPAYQTHFVNTWKWLANRYKNNKTVYSYDILNEPAEGTVSGGAKNWYNLAKETITEIRNIDPDKPIVFEPSTDIGSLTPFDFEHIVYSTHFYDPHEITHQGILSPCCMDARNYPYNSSNPKIWGKTQWNKSILQGQLQPLKTFQDKYKSRNLKIFIGEFGAVRWTPGTGGAKEYIQHCIEIFEGWDWDWAYFEYRYSDAWDPELSTNKNDLNKPAQPTNRVTLLKQAFCKNN